jgi:hypothetical protein
MSENKYMLVPLTEVLKPGVVLNNLNFHGIRTLEDCAKAGSQKVFGIKDIGKGAVVALRQECRKRRIHWEKDEDEWKAHDRLKSKLMDEYGFSGAQAEQICEVHFYEGWTDPPLKKMK